jgi:hypothetical protein
MNFHIIGLPIERTTRPDLSPASDQPHAVVSPYRVRFASYIRNGETTHSRFEDVPEQWRMRLLAVQAYDACGVQLGLELVEGRHVEEAVGRLLAGPNARYLQIHYINPGRIAARIERG